MGRFYYRPVTPFSGGGEFGEGIARGITAGTANFLDEYRLGRAEKRQEEEDARRRQREDTEDLWRETQQDIFLTERGGGRGRAPGSQDLDFGGIGMAAGSRGRSPLLDLPEVDLKPQEGLFDRMNRESGGRVYRNVGSVGYIEDPEFRTKRLEREEREGTVGRVGGALVRRGIDPEKAYSGAELLGEGVGTFGQLFPEEEPAFDLNTDPDYQRRKALAEFYMDEGYSPTGARLDTSVGSDAPDMLDYQRALRTVSDMYPSPEFQGDPERPSPAELHEQALDLLRDPDSFRPWERVEGEVLQRGLGRLLPGPSRGPARYQRPGADIEKQTITKDQADYLREVHGMSREEINRRYIIR